jgi:2-octaprenyl-6-methoxyphenol hydroxylase
VKDHVDVLIAGGGPVGATLALALRGSGRSVSVLEARSDFSERPDPRTLALSYGSRLILDRLGIWPELAPTATAIETIHISQKGGLGRAVLHAADEGFPALGHVVSYAALDRALHRALEAAEGEIDYVTGARVVATRATQGYATAEYEQSGRSQLVTARLLALADGGRALGEMSGMKRHVRDYGQSAVIAQVQTELPHNHVAYERFTPEGPAALLPSGDGFALVWTARPDAATALCELDDGVFLARLHEHFGDRLGRFISAGKRSTFPLSLHYSRPVVGSRTVLLGNAAQMLHPVAGQGFNMGLRDAWELSSQVRATEADDLGGVRMLARYRDGRRLDTTGGILFTDTLVRLFSNDNAVLQHARGIGLIALEALPPLKHFVARRMIFGAKG